jgi:hypothetical protein
MPLTDDGGAPYRNLSVGALAKSEDAIGSFLCLHSVLFYLRYQNTKGIARHPTLLKAQRVLRCV